MKKHLLIASAALICSVAMGQTGGKKINYLRPVFVHEDRAPSEADVQAPLKRTASAVIHKSSSVCQPQRVTGCVNAFTVGGGVTTYMQNVLSYNKDLNALVLTARMSCDWPVAGTGLTNNGAGGGTFGGSIQCTFLDLNTNIWDSTVIYRDSASTLRGRFAGGTFFNPTGNTSLGNAFVAGAGSVTNGSAWQGAWYSTRSLSGGGAVYHKISSAQEHKSFCADGTAPFGRVGNSTTNLGFLNMDMQQHGQELWSMGAIYRSNGDVTGAVIGKGSYSSGTFTWGADSSLKPPFYDATASTGLQNDAEGARIAFDPTGQIGYAVFNGRLATNYGNAADQMMMPIVYKTNDGGLSWNLVLDGYDWTTGHPELMKNVGTLANPYRPTGYTATRFTPYLRHGVDLTVDSKGVLHYVTTLMDPYQNGQYADSLQYSYTYNWDYVHHHPVIWDLMTDGNCWKTMMVDSIITSYVGGDPTADTTASFSAWSSPSGSPMLAYGAHLTVSRSADGNVVFYGWGDTDTTISGTHFNQQPDILMKAYDVTSAMTSTTVPVTSGIGQCFFSYLSDVSYFDAGQNSWVVPFVYLVGRKQTAGVYDGGYPCDFYYGNCATFKSTDMTLSTQINNDLNHSATCDIGIKTHQAELSSVNNHPNPFNGSTNIVVTLAETKNIEVRVYDAIGNQVWSKKAAGSVGENTFVFDGTGLSPGIYYYTLTSGYEKVTRKLVLQK